MKRILLLFVTAIISTQSVHATTVSKYFDQGAIYSGSSFPIDVAKNADGGEHFSAELKCGEATTNNILGLVEIGNRGIQAAAKNGGIKKISHIDIQEKSVFIFWCSVKVTVYGE